MKFISRLIVPALKECADEGVRLGLGAAIRYVEDLAETKDTDIERELLADVAVFLRTMSIEYDVAEQ